MSSGKKKSNVTIEKMMTQLEHTDMRVLPEKQQRTHDSNGKNNSNSHVDNYGKNLSP